MKIKTAIFGNRSEVFYDAERWRILEEKREIAKKIMEVLKSNGIDSIIYGSIARGDVKKDSDVDIFIPYNIPSYRIELALQEFKIVERRIVQATPNYAIKGEIVIENANISFPLVKMKDRELDFYRFGGALTFEEVKKGLRSIGVDKRLMLIIPRNYGHLEIPLNEIDKSEAADILKVSVEIIEERMRVLEKRREIGRTGIFLYEIVPEEESFESFLNNLSSRNQFVRRKMKKQS